MKCPTHVQLDTRVRKTRGQDCRDLRQHVSTGLAPGVGNDVPASRASGITTCIAPAPIDGIHSEALPRARRDSLVAGQIISRVPLRARRLPIASKHHRCPPLEWYAEEPGTPTQCRLPGWIALKMQEAPDLRKTRMQGCRRNSLSDPRRTQIRIGRRGSARAAPVPPVAALGDRRRGDLDRPRAHRGGIRVRATARSGAAT